MIIELESVWSAACLTLFEFPNTLIFFPWMKSELGVLLNVSVKQTPASSKPDW
jgi:hypothetical protein